MNTYYQQNRFSYNCSEQTRNKQTDLPHATNRIKTRQKPTETTITPHNLESTKATTGDARLSINNQDRNSLSIHLSQNKLYDVFRKSANKLIEKKDEYIHSTN